MATGGIEYIIETPSGPIRVYSIHLSSMNSHERLLQIDHLLELHHNSVCRIRSLMRARDSK